MKLLQNQMQSTPNLKMWTTHLLLKNFLLRSSSLSTPVCKALVCAALVCEALVCEAPVCKALVCEAPVCTALVCEAPVSKGHVTAKCGHISQTD